MAIEAPPLRAARARPAADARPGAVKAFLVDTIATVAFFTVLAALVELIVVGMAPGQVLVARAIMIPVMVLTARPYGLWRDWLFQRLRPTGTAGRIFTDTASFLSFQMPVYAATLVVVGADLAEIATAILTATTFMLVLGRPFGLYLDAVRRLAGTAPPAPRPTSPVTGPNPQGEGDAV